MNAAFFFAYKLNFSNIIWLNQSHIQNLANFVVQSKLQFLTRRVQNIFFNNVTQIFVLAIQFVLVLVSFKGYFGEFSLGKWINGVLLHTRYILFQIPLSEYIIKDKGV